MLLASIPGQLFILYYVKKISHVQKMLHTIQLILPDLELLGNEAPVSKDEEFLFFCEYPPSQFNNTMPFLLYLTFEKTD